MRAGAVLLICAAGLAACGGEASPEADEPSGSFPVDVTSASFPLRQHVSKNTDLVLAVENTGDETIPQLAVTIWTATGGTRARKPQGSFNVQTDGAGTRPAWVPTPGFPKLLARGATPRSLDSAPSAGAEAAQTDTYAFGALRPRQSRTIVWRVTPVRAGAYTLRYALAAGLGGKQKAVTTSGAPVAGAFHVTIE